MRLAVLAGSLLFWLPIPAFAEEWVRVRSPHFEVLSDAGEPLARGAAARLELLRSALPQLLPAAVDDEPSVRVLLFRLRADVERLVPSGRRSADVAGFFVGCSDGPCLALSLEGAPEGRWGALDH
jgi:hypothetical protein